MIFHQGARLFCRAFCCICRAQAVAGWELAFRTDLEGNVTKSFSASQNGQRASRSDGVGQGQGDYRARRRVTNLPVHLRYAPLS